MPRKPLNLSGAVLGNLTVLEEMPERTTQGRVLWRCRCACGTEVIREGREMKKCLKRGMSPVCGKKCPFRRTPKTHGMTEHPAFAVWSSMKARCQRETHAAYHNYGGRGISVCPEWLESFENFWRDMGPTYVPGLDLDRIDNDGNYEPGNCRWTTREVNANNRRKSVKIETPWGLLSLRQASRKSGIGVTTLLYRLQNGATGDALFSAPCTTSSLRDR